MKIGRNLVPESIKVCFLVLIKLIIDTGLNLRVDQEGYIEEL